jgi:hypothetical protein
MSSMNQLTREKRVAVVKALVEGNSIRATVRMTGVAKNTVVKLLVDLGAACADYQDEAVLNLKTERSSSTKSGPSSGPTTRTSQPRIAASSGVVASGRGGPSTPIPSWWCPS